MSDESNDRKEIEEEIEKNNDAEKNEIEKQTEIEKPILNPFVNRLPSSEMYYRSYMHKDTVQFVASSPQNNFFLSMSVDGVLKFWHKPEKENELDFVKKISTKDGTFFSYSISYDGKYIATGSKNGRVCIFDIPSFDLINRFDFKIPDAVTVCFFHDNGIPIYQLGIAFSSKPEIIIIDILDLVDENNSIPKTLSTIPRTSSKPIVVMNFILQKNCAITVDADGAIEFFKSDGTTPEFDFQSTFETDLYSLAADDLRAVSIAVAKPGNYFAICCNNWSVKIFETKTCKIVRTLVETNENAYGLDQDDFDSRVLSERQFRVVNSYFCVDFDDSGTIISFPTQFGIKFISVETGDLLRIIGRVEKHERFNSVALMPDEKSPAAILTSFDKLRFYLFTNKPPESSKRDVLNEKSNEKTVKTVKIRRTTLAKLPTVAILHTTFGSIKFEMYPDECPKTVENFVTHAKRGYYDNIRFHRVIRNFCVQTGDPTGSGIGGESIWGKTFEDEILPDGHTFDEPFMVGMANSGKNTNASQFFITTASAKNLNGLHTCWGKVIDGFDTIRRMELVKVDIHHHPWDEIKLVNITFD
ncbi:Peptidyl-prolyl cis-trans isomerase cyp15 [Tritrichomonas foetus]|uniref:peptidylprolyl isomerase n=1 Tax=Tritrichomonas foetus TaxID=1144522 RepID=A0A1J4JQN1_9EUKA|nr:Peptidyl-prolyl cis-trans isomerase cyp15 [Tritrichomonas foetus]|eukprot:OHT01347.1 Peptidyl-prolyl cis-trans isomerase cyp15 [Tritrichomonas foetus]